MNIHWSAPCLKYGLGVVFGLGLIGIVPLPGMAQITPDETLGDERSQINRDVQVRGGNADRIEGGATRGANLFHSFEEFNVNEGQRVYFANPAGIANILSRVTGRDVSDIMGTLGVEGSANLFLLNPNGIIFGPNARLDISGSFFSSTANGFTFPDGTEFSATNPGDSSLLSVSVPLGVQYGPNAPGAISNAGTLSVGQNFRLSGGSVTSTGQLFAPSGQLWVEGVAGDVQVRSAGAQTATFSASNNLFLQDSQLQTAGDLNLFAGNTVQVRDSVANPFVAYAGGNLTVQGNQNIDIFALNHPSSGLVSGGDMVLRSANTVGGDAHYWSGGSFQIEQLDGKLGDLSSPYDPIVFAVNDVRLGDYVGSSLHILAGGDVVLGDITINATDTSGNTIGPNNPDPRIAQLSEVDLPDGTSIPIDGSTQRTLDVRAGINWQEAGGFPAPNIGGGFVQPPGSLTPFFGSILPNPNESLVLTDSSITINSITNRGAGQVLLTNQYKSTGSASGVIQVTGVIPDQGSTDAPNNLGNQSISAYGTDVMIVSSGGVGINNSVIAGTDVGDGGDITIYSGGTIDTGSLQSQVGTGFGGFITLRAGGEINTTRGGLRSFSNDGLAGDVTLEAFGDIFVGNIVAESNSNSIAPDDFSQILVDSSAGSIFLDGATLNTTNSGTGFAGVIDIAANDRVVLNGSAIYSDGFAGAIGITGGDRVVLNGSAIYSDGYRGLIDIAADDRVIITDRADGNNGRIPSRISTEGIAGRIRVLAPNRIRITNSILNAINNTDETVAFDPYADFSAILVASERGIVNLDRATLTTEATNRDFGIAGAVVVTARDRILIHHDSELSSEGYFGQVYIGRYPYDNKGDPLFGVEPERVTIDNSMITSSTSTRRRGSDVGEVSISATDSVRIRNGSTVRATTTSQNRNANDGGDIYINTRLFYLTDSRPTDPRIVDPDNFPFTTFLDASTFGEGNAGNITILADEILLDDDVRIYNNAESSSVFNDVFDDEIDREELDSRSIGARGDAGDITIRNIAIDEEGNIILDEEGNITFTRADSLRLTGGAQIQSLIRDDESSTLAAAQGDGGTINIDARDIVLDTGSQIYASVEGNAEGDGGDIDITANSLRLDDSSLDAQAFNGNSRAGDITIVADQFDLQNNSGVKVSNGQGSAGDLTVTVGSINLDNIDLVNSALEDNSVLEAAAGGNGVGGNITLTSRQPLLLFQNLEGLNVISAEAFGNATGGNVTLNVPDGFIAVNEHDDTNIVANASEGRGGEIEINTNQIFGFRERRASPYSDLDASSESGIQGTVTLNTLNIDPTRGLGELETEIINAADLVAEGCVGSNRRGDETQGEFTRTGRGGLSPDPTDTLTDDSLIDPSTPADAPEPASAVPSDPAETASQPIVEAQGLARSASGKVELVSGSANSPVTSPGFAPNTCDAP